MRAIATLFALALLCIQGAASAATYSYPGEGRALFSVEIPDRWEVDAQGERLRATPPDRSLQLGFTLLDPSLSGEPLRAALDAIVGRFVAAPRQGGKREIDVNGMPLSYRQGSGTDPADGQVLRYGVGIFRPGGQGLAVVMYYATPEKEALHQATLSAIIRSLRPVKPVAAEGGEWRDEAIGGGWVVKVPASAKRVTAGPDHRFILHRPHGLLSARHDATAGDCPTQLENTHQATLRVLASGRSARLTPPMEISPSVGWRTPHSRN